MIRLIGSRKTYETIGGVWVKKCTVRGETREALEFTVTGEYTDIADDFSDGAACEIVDETGAYDKSAYCVAGPITDNRDGTFTVIMGMKTDKEIMADLLDGLVADNIITPGQLEDIAENRLPKVEVITQAVNQFTGQVEQSVMVKNYLEA